MIKTTSQRQIVREAEKDVDSAWVGLEKAESELKMAKQNNRQAHIIYRKALSVYSDAISNLERTRKPKATGHGQAIVDRLFG